jgi:glycosyltransferase involved in cell wall biosynthesis
LAYFAGVNWSEQCAGIIPCLNEAAALDGLLKGLAKHLHRIYVVDDGSRDGTGRIARANGAVVIRHDSTRGKGLSLEAGLTRAYADGMSWGLCLDGDGQHEPADIPKFFEMAERSGAALIIGNRMGATKSMPWIRRWVNRWMSARLSGLCQMDLPDSQCGFRLLNLEAWSGLNLRAAHFEIESEMLVRFVTGRHAVKFVSIQTKYGQESSKIRPVPDSARWLRWYFQTRRKMGGRAARPKLAHDLPSGNF